MSAKNLARVRRARQTRLRIREVGTVRLTVHRTNTHIYAQITSPAGDKVLAAASTDSTFTTTASARVLAGLAARS